jgi:serine phosphatase RsbU (regulator of sigma subunit)/Flp pilus assembly protein TadD
MIKNIYINIIGIREMLFLFAIVLCFKVNSQSNAIDQDGTMDSLKVLLKNAKHDTSRCYILGMMIEAEPDEEAWPKYNLQLKKIAQENLKKGINDEKIRRFYLKHLANTLNDEAYSLLNIGDVSSALELYHQSLNINQGLGNKVGMSITFNDLGTIYFNQGDVNKALEYFEKSLKIQRAVGDKLGEANSLNNIGLTYKSFGDIRKALNYYNKSLVLQKEIGNKASEAVTLSNIGSTYIVLNDNSKALLYLTKAIALQEEIKDQSGISATLNILARLMLKQNNYDLAAKYANQGLKISLELGYPDNISENALILKKIYKQQKNIVKELEMYELFVLMKDSIANEKNRRSSIRSQFRYEYEKKATADSIKVAEEKKITDAQLKQEKTQRFALYSGLALVALFAAFMFNRFKVTQRQKNIISHQKEEVELQRHEANFQKELVQVKQKEIIDSINYARRLQNAILPPKDFINTYLPDNFVYYKPKDIVAGDFYWMHIGDDKKMFLAAADSTGHGVPGAMVSIVCSNALDKAVKEFGLTDTGKILDKTRKLVLETFSKSGEDIKDGMDISLLCIDKQQLKVTWSGANNHLVIIKWDNGTPLLTEIKGDKQPIGNSDQQKPFTTHSVPFENGQLCYLMTDGYADQFGGPKGKKFKSKHLKEVLLENSNLELSQQKEILNQYFQDWKGNLDQVDDVTIIGIKL